jgi:hypothetical protein
VRAVPLLLCLFAAPTALADGWRSIDPSFTKESQLIAAFGPPAEVVASFPWSEWEKRGERKPGRYTLHYRSDLADSPLLTGPGGKAREQEPEGGAVTRGNSGFLGPHLGMVHVEIGANDADVRVGYHLK